MTFEQAVSMTWEADWRLPRISELETLLTAESESGVYIAAVAFPDVLEDSSRWYWSSTSDGPLLAWAVNFHHGKAYSGGRHTKNAVRLVRSGR